jgi:hypothetical protein
MSGQFGYTVGAVILERRTYATNFSKKFKNITFPENYNQVFWKIPKEFNWLNLCC